MVGRVQERFFAPLRMTYTGAVRLPRPAHELDGRCPTLSFPGGQPARIPGPAERQETFLVLRGIGSTLGAISDYSTLPGSKSPKRMNAFKSSSVAARRETHQDAVVEGASGGGVSRVPDAAGVVNADGPGS